MSKLTPAVIQRMIDSPKVLPHPSDLFHLNGGWPIARDLFTQYYLEYERRQITRLRREKMLLRAALEGIVPYTPVEPVYALRILQLTEDK